MLKAARALHSVLSPHLRRTHEAVARLPQTTRRLAASTPLRLAVVLAVVFTLVSLATLGVAWWQLRATLLDQIDATLSQQVAGFSVTDDPDALAALVAAEAAALDPEHRVLVYQPPNGPMVGNARARLDADRIRLKRRPGGGRLGDDGYRIRSVSLAGGTLIVGESLEPLDELGDIFEDLLVWSVVPTAVLSLLLGLWLALASRARVQRIEDALDRLTHGDLDVRVAEPAGHRDDLAHIGASLNRMAAAQQATMHALKQVSADIAHDLKTPVQRIAFLLDDARAQLDNDHRARDLLDRAALEAERAVSIFHALLAIAQIESGRARERFATLDLAALARELCELFEPTAEERGQRLVCHAPAPTTVIGDRHLLAQLVTNLIENALNHTPPGTTVRVSVQGHASAVVTLVVEDDGPGIPASERPRVLERFYRLEQARHSPGHGLGLALVAAIARLHDATLTLDDAHPKPHRLHHRPAAPTPAVSAGRAASPTPTASDSGASDRPGAGPGLRVSVRFPSR